MLGAWSAADAGQEFNANFWSLIDHHWRTGQHADGSWAYSAKESDVRFSMCAAGVASLYVTKEQTELTAALEGKPDPNLQLGLAYLAENTEKQMRGMDLYAYFACERVGEASGLKFFGPCDWYARGAANILKNQQPGGFWKSSVIGAKDPDVDTAFAILFLARGLYPIAFEKLAWKGPWDARLLDDLHLSRWLSKELETPVNWEAVGLQSPVSGWLDAPVLLITGHGDPKFSPEDLDKLHAYVDAGGLIFSTADGSDKAFTAAVQKYAPAVSSSHAPMAPLPEGHPIYTRPYNVAKPVRLMGASNGVRMVWVHASSDMGAAWQTRAYSKAGAFQEPANIYLYASGRESPDRRFRLTLPPPGPPGGATVHLARLRYEGNWDPEPAAWKREAARLAAETGTAVDARPQSIADISADKCPAAWITGTDAFTPSPDDVKKLQAYLNAGGTLLADAAGGSDAFTASFQNLAKQLFPSDSLAVVPDDDWLYTGAGHLGSPLKKIQYRHYFITTNGSSNGRRVLGVKHNNRWVILFSPDDLAAGLAGLNTWGISGPTSISADALARNMLAVAFK